MHFSADLIPTPLARYQHPTTLPPNHKYRSGCAGGGATGGRAVSSAPVTPVGRGGAWPPSARPRWREAASRRRQTASRRAHDNAVSDDYTDTNTPYPQKTRRAHDNASSDDYTDTQKTFYLMVSLRSIRLHKDMLISEDIIYLTRFFVTSELLFDWTLPFNFNF